MLERSKQRKLSTDADSTVPTSKALTTLTNEAGHQSGQIFGNTFFECHLTIKDNQVHFNSLMALSAMNPPAAYWQCASFSYFRLDIVQFCEHNPHCTWE
ncbi:DNA-directed RNA polymerase subunit beta [Trichinella pseudospiralis]